MQTSLHTAPAVDPVTLTEVKNHLRIDLLNFDHDDYLKNIIAAAVHEIEQITKRRLITQTWQAFYDYWPSNGFLELPFGQLQSVTHVKYTDTDADVTTWDSSEYIVDTDSDPGRVVLGYGESWPTDTLYPSNPIEVQFVCGYGLAVSVPDMIKQAIKLKISDLFENRESTVVGGGITVVNQLASIKQLLRPYRLGL